MASITEPTWEDGVYLAVDRDRAKQLFSAKTTAALNAFFDDCCSDREWIASRAVAKCDGHWPELQQQLESLADAADEQTRPLLQWAARGVRPVAEEKHSFVVRPDVVPPIADALRAVEMSTSTAVGELLIRMRQVYDTAAAERAAVALLYRPA